MLGDVFSSVGSVMGEMALASVRGRASRTQLGDWAARLRLAARALEEASTR